MVSLSPTQPAKAMVGEGEGGWLGFCFVSVINYCNWSQLFWGQCHLPSGGWGNDGGFSTVHTLEDGDNACTEGCYCDYRVVVWASPENDAAVVELKLTGTMVGLGHCLLEVDLQREWERDELAEWDEQARIEWKLTKTLIGKITQVCQEICNINL
jgi:hypothetical protein